MNSFIVKILLSLLLHKLGDILQRIAAMGIKLIYKINKKYKNVNLLNLLLGLAMNSVQNICYYKPCIRIYLVSQRKI